MTEQERIREHRKLTAALRKEVLKKYNYACAFCGTKNEDVPLELAHVIPLHRGGESSEENLISLCPNCHRAMDMQPREIEFVNFLSDLLKRHPNFKDVAQEEMLGRAARFRADILTRRNIGNRQETLVIECKTPKVLFWARINDVIAQLDNYRKLCGDCKMVLAVPGTLRPREITALENQSVELWDLDYLAKTFSAQIKDAPISYYKAVFLTRLGRIVTTTREQTLINSLKACRPGKQDWYVYQSLIGDILECLFTPPLSKPIPELSDKAQANRRDYILPNYAEKGFGAFMRDKYGADYIVVDAKNYSRKIKKTEVLQLANYLKDHGAGLFGMIVCRHGGDSSGCEHTIREQWMVHRKLIIVLDDEDIENMLLAKSDGNPPEDVVSRKIEQFRLSM